jgi:7-cyano-7-deazaguanine synthase
MMSLLLLSGGIDSLCLACVFRPQLCLTVDYGQRVAPAEIDASGNICSRLNLRHHVARVDVADLGAGIMAGGEQRFPGAAPEWWPFRNQFLITVAAMVALKNGLAEILIGTVRSDRRHKDGSRRFLNQMDKTLRQQEGNIRLIAPARHWSSEELVDECEPSLDLLGMSFSCHRSIFPCGQCRGCRKNEAVVSHAILQKRKLALFGKTRQSRNKHALVI